MRRLMVACVWVNAVVLVALVVGVVRRPDWWPLFAVLMVSAVVLAVAAARALRMPLPAPVSTLTVSQSVPVGERLMVGTGGGQEMVRVIAVEGSGPFTLTVEVAR